MQRRRKEPTWRETHGDIDRSHSIWPRVDRHRVMDDKTQNMLEGIPDPKGWAASRPIDPNDIDRTDSPFVPEINTTHIGDAEYRVGHPFRSREQQFYAQVSMYSNYEGGWELDERQPNIGQDRSREHEPRMNRLVKPWSGVRRAQ